MLKEFMSGEASLKDTFWKFGILGLLIFMAAIRIFGRLLAAQTMGVSIVQYYMHHFSPINPNGAALLWTLCYLASLILFISFCIVLLKSVWKAAAAYKKSPILAFFAKVFTLFFVSVAIYSVF